MAGAFPNERGLIVSSMENGTRPEFQLASEGVNQAELAGELFQKELKKYDIPLDNVRICYSPFSRTTQTAKVVAAVLKLPFDGPQCKVLEDLRERFFGPSFELMSHDRYSDIWDLDEKDPLMRPEEGGESVNDVASRLTKALATIELEFKGCAILVVSHGDPLQILQTMFNAVNHHREPSCNDLASRFQAVQVPSILSQHRKYALQTGELRAVAQNLLLYRTEGAASAELE
ncbi:Phosphoglycerate mutase family protein [Quillaja saponaria]|uniref:Phosphoglycerate mutase family protein n=1 Tax=Quillaja saponaria TaxID=32244 RepID=A0AAD7QCC4_QUISA|nr:Phosphoglycerate mutase family protein [Quillaja saponaria]KAJ7978695.1 Phosphoglycerate mutase family protein [Quillaja saponaria]